MWRRKNWKTEKLTTQLVTKLKNSNYEETQKLKKWQNFNCDKTHMNLSLWRKNFFYGSLSMNILTHWQPMRCCLGIVLGFSLCFLLVYTSPPHRPVYIGSTVRLRFRKSIFGHHSQTIGKLASIDFNYHTEVVNSI